jgi:Skp family chaperone for outer membrane proteins
MRRFQEAVAKNQGDMEKRQQELIQPIAQRLKTIILSLGKREGFTVILNRPEQLTLFATNEIDLTDAAVKEYNRGHGRTDYGI